MWSWSSAWSATPVLLKAMVVTIQATIAGFLLAVVVGLIIAVALRSRYKFLSKTLGWFVEFIRSTPLLIQLYFLFYVLPVYGLSLSPFTAGVIGLGMHYSTYLSEVYRSGIEAVAKGQWEASIALNYSRAQIWGKIILPQAVPPLIPVFGNYLISMFKETPLLSAITLLEMLGRAKIIGTRTFHYLEPLTIVGLLFLFLSYSSSILVRRLEKRIHLKYGTNLSRKN